MCIIILFLLVINMAFVFQCIGDDFLFVNLTEWSLLNVVFIYDSVHECDITLQMFYNFQLVLFIFLFMSSVSLLTVVK